MESYIKDLIQNLCDYCGYNIVEIEKIDGVYVNWGVYKRIENELDVVFFSDLDSSYKLDINELKIYFKKYLQCENLKLSEVMVDDRLKVIEDENGNFHLNHKINPQCELILINNVDNKILYFSEAIKEKANELASCMNHIGNSKRSREKQETPIVTYVLIGLNVLMYLITAYLSGNIVDSNINVLVFLGAKVNELIKGGEYYRFITCMFLHGGIIHLALNMFALKSLGPLIEQVYGKVKYIIIYFLSGILSSIFSYMFSTSVSIGASGAIFGLLGAALILALKMKGSIGKGFMTNILSVIAVNLFMGFSIPNVDNFGHLGGLIGGIITSFLLSRV
ncbi:rhomboid family intramembrane serine protease [Clostridiaceae bacterium UIB06]|uniref:Rhomboid family intramembrane serine protease n=1 Tax=Clostridium thailandense TaxID=2794346 RepID=A0A949TTC5_9CLOT|nr:rhomboid family intramembrane serine protease [Clostridium thailandense]MBV7274992.1 rhomboid family intramembrane serine protease [Clostridium thailandense]MCH5137911.1 rhomboid family intramembrane serine protease [Clostridiaceae bacterium UIB06]